MTPTILWHNPRCSKSRATLALLQENGITPEIVKYLDTPPSADAIRNALQLLGIPAIRLVRTGEDLFNSLGLDETDSDATLITAMATYPKLIERPVLFANGQAAIGRPPESVLDIL
jgi:arsenate reductase